MSLERAQGALAGVALGDSLGMPGELWPREQVVAHFGWIDRFLPGPDGHFVVDGYQAGQITDDTQQTLMLAGALIEGEGRAKAETVAKHLVDWAVRVGAAEGNFLGPSSARAIEKLKAGADPRTTGAGGETNGATMRIAPIGIVYGSKDLEALVDGVVESCVMSHDTSIAIAGASLIAGAISAAIDGETLEGALETGFKAAEIGRTRGELVVAASVVSRAHLAIRIAREANSDNDFLQQLYDMVGASVHTVDTVPAAVGLVFRAQGDPVKTATLAANLGGDTDTIGAIATGLSGALKGIKAIPAEMLQTIRDVNNIDPVGVATELYGLRR